MQDATHTGGFRLKLVGPEEVIESLQRINALDQQTARQEGVVRSAAGPGSQLGASRRKAPPQAVAPLPLLLHARRIPVDYNPVLIGHGLLADLRETERVEITVGQLVRVADLQVTPRPWRCSHSC